jgi:hypothetical protein
MSAISVAFRGKGAAMSSKRHFQSIRGEIVEHRKRNELPVMFHTSDVLRITTFWNDVLYI